jgi:hypothetical protein
MTFKIPTLQQGQALGEFFRDAGFTVEGVQQVFGAESLPLPTADNLAPMLERTAEPTRLNVLIRWFRIGYSVPDVTAASVIDAEDLHLLIDCGMLRAQHGSWYPEMMLTPFLDFLIASDNHDPSA